MDQQHHKSDQQLYYGGADADTDVNLKKKETYVDSQNMRPNTVDGHTGAINKIHGETVLYPNIDNRCGGAGMPLPLTYRCIGNYNVLNHKVEFWADVNQVLVPYVRVDGWVVLYPNTISDFPISTNYPPQLHGNDSCVGGEVFYTDNHIPPFILNVTDLLTNAGITNNIQDCSNATDKYFSGYDISQSSINQALQLDHPIFVEVCLAGTTLNTLPNALIVKQNGGGGSGLTPGKYQYSFQYQDSSGNTTNFTPFSPVVSMPINIGYSWEGNIQPETVYPGAQVFGGISGNKLTQSLSMHIRFRLTNMQGYTSVNVRRIRWTLDAAEGTLGIDEIISAFDITTSFVGIVDFYDNDLSSIEPTPTQETTDSFDAISAAKAIRYYDQRLNLMNITFESLDLSNQIVLGASYPFVRSMGYEGYKDPWNEAYRKSYFRGELYNMAWVGWDMNGNPSFAGVTVPANMPNRRDPLEGASLTASIEANRDNNILTAVNSNPKVSGSYAVSQTFEVYDGVHMNQRDPAFVSPNANSGFYKTVASPSSGTIANKSVGYQTAGYFPFRPIGEDNLESSPFESFNYLPTVGVNDGTILDSTLVGQTGGSSLADNIPNPGGQLTQLEYNYNPHGFAPNLYSLGRAFEGISGIPSYISAFTFVRSVPANKVIAQGQSYYSLNYSVETSKNLNKVIWDSPDVYGGYASLSTSYSAQFVSPNGMFSEVLSAVSGISPIINGSGSSKHSIIDGNNNASGFIDMISYPRISFDTNLPYSDGGNYINTTLNANENMAGVQNSFLAWTAWDSWRNGSTGLVSPNTTTNFTFSQTGTSGSAARQQAWLLNLASNIYATSSQFGGVDFIDSSIKSYHEPLYIVNIINPSAVVPVTNVQGYVQTECYVKVSSIVGISNSKTTSYPMVDERWQDFIPALLSTDFGANEDRYAYIKDPITNNIQTWLNVTYKTASQITAIQNDILVNGFYISTNCNGTVEVTGIFTHTIETAVPNYINGIYPSDSNNVYSIVFNYNMPSSGSYVIIKYDPCTLIEVFGGDSYIGEYNYPVIDQNRAGVPCSVPLPYRGYQLNNNTVVIYDANDLTNTSSVNGLEIQRWNIINQTYNSNGSTGLIRQLICNGIVESRVNLAMGYAGLPQLSFPTCNYQLKPCFFNPNVPQANLSSQYVVDYDDSVYPLAFNYGGFNIMDQTVNGTGVALAGGLEFNNDYSENANNLTFNSKPATGFVEQLNFCSLVVYSDQRATNQQDSPNLKNFPVLNQYTLDDATGEIKRAYSQLDRNGENLYAFTEIGLALLLTNKQLLQEQSGQTLAAIGNSNGLYIQDAQFVSRSVGMNDETWRTASEYNNQIWFANKSSTYKFSAKGLEDISGGYDSIIRDILNNIGSGYSTYITSVWDNKYKEYRLQTNENIVITDNTYIYGTTLTQDGIYSIITNGTIINLFGTNTSILDEFFVINNSGSNIGVITPFSSGGIPSFYLLPGITYRVYFNVIGWQFDTNYKNLVNNIVYNDDMKKWVGNFRYIFDNYVSDINDTVYGARDGALYQLESGYIINGSTLEAYVVQACAADLGQSKEFWYGRYNVETKPDYINFYNSRDSYENNLIFAQINALTNPLGLKNYGMGWGQYIPRGMNLPYYRTQGNYVIFQIGCSQSAEFRLYSTEIKYKLLV